MTKMKMSAAKELIARYRDPVFYDALSLFVDQEPKNYEKTEVEAAAMVSCLYHLEQKTRRWNPKLQQIQIADAYISRNY